MPEYASPTISMQPDLLPEIRSAVEHALDVTGLKTSRLDGGVNRRTFLAEKGDRSWVVRIEPGDSPQLRRAFTAQTLAEAAGVAVPKIVTADLAATTPGRLIWIVEERISGRPFHPNDFDQADSRRLSIHLGE